LLLPRVEEPDQEGEKEENTRLSPGATQPLVFFPVTGYMQAFQVYPGASSGVDIESH